MIEYDEMDDFIAKIGDRQVRKTCLKAVRNDKREMLRAFERAKRLEYSQAQICDYLEDKADVINDK